ncbi:hypothetical protein MNEG_14935 [Monoraphidium neglectum]|uniref:Uncharacterized protein n=1 Tax=Monoraphidium neglectum TaxID=145388 RepID=A0A0D2KAH4_9CHLO|nr:hypothetical protein MNEG_14935 [Monoraphidium neglectum]KIY93028.1 hypothetical protein MNEG_14935 [Monoraphidium neglectum]|eukprot:XP_013892048.1 hypothetical protein MNEG_14935 [Monoraphidium neglectum]
MVVIMPCRNLIPHQVLYGPTPADAAVDIGLKLGGVLVEARPPPRLQLSAGRPARIRGDGYLGATTAGAHSVVPGQRVGDILAELHDASGNLCLQRVEAEVTFDPEDAVEVERMPTRGKGVGAPSPLALEFVNGQLRVANRFTVSGRPGQGFVMMISAKLADSDGSGRALAPLVTHFRIQRMHLALNHATLLPLANCGRMEGPDGIDTFVLNTWEQPQHHGRNYSALEGVPRLLLEAFESRDDVIRGVVQACYVRPTGEVLREGKMPKQLLLDAINRHMDQPPMVNDVYEAGFVIDPSKAKHLSDLEITICNEEDMHDPDFCAPVKLLRDGEPVAAGSLGIRGGKMSLPRLALPPAWFGPHNAACVEFDLRDARHEDFSYGKFWVRHRRAAARLAILPAGRLFEGTRVVVPSGAGGAAPEALRLLQQAGGVRAGAGPAWAAWRVEGRDRPVYLHPRTAAVSPRGSPAR